MNAAKAMNFLYKTERQLTKNVTDVLKDMDIHVSKISNPYNFYETFKRACNKAKHIFLRSILIIIT